MARLQETSPAMVTAKALQLAVADLQTTRPGPALGKTLLLALLIAPALYVAVIAESWWTAGAAAIWAGIAITAALITTHDAIHHTFTGITWVDEVLPRLISWPVLWAHSTYSEVHKLHHKMNGDDINDPERIQWTREEYAQASAIGRFYVRHQWVLDLFVLGGLGLIAHTLRAGCHYAQRSKTMRRALMTDVVGMIALNFLIYAVAYAHGVALRWLFIWVILERITGGVMQWRAHIEHYGLWGKGRHYFETQTYNCRNLHTGALTSWFFNRLNFHSVHHAFPRVPFYALSTAHERFAALYESAGGEPLVIDEGYWTTSWRLLRHPTLIGNVDPASASQRRLMVPVAELELLLNG